MKKLFIFIICLITVSCSEPTPEVKIEKAFKNYVNENFDNPKDLIEIISVTFKDSISRANVDEARELIADGHKIIEIMMTEESRLWEKFGNANLRYNGDQKVLSLATEIFNASEDIDKWQKNNTKRGDKLYEKINKNYTQLDSTLIFTSYEIKARVKQNGEPKITYFYSIYSTDKIEIYKEKKYPEPFEGIMNDCIEQLYMIKEMTELWQTQLNTTKKLLDYLKIDY